MCRDKENGDIERVEHDRGIDYKSIKYNLFLKVGANIKPRWSSFAFMYKVWMCSSLRGAVDTAPEMIAHLKEGAYGCCGTGYDTKEMPLQDIYGVWIVVMP